MSMKKNWRALPGDLGSMEHVAFWNVPHSRVFGFDCRLPVVHCDFNMIPNRLYPQWPKERVGGIPNWPSKFSTSGATLLVERC